MRNYSVFELATKIRNDCFEKILMAAAFIAVAIFILIDPFGIYNTLMMIYGIVLIVLAVIIILASIIIYKRSNTIAEKRVKEKELLSRINKK